MTPVSRLEDVFSGHVELTASQRAHVVHALEEAYVRGEIPHGVGNRRDFCRSVVAALITPLRLTRMVTPDGAELVSPEEYRARFEQVGDPAAGFRGESTAGAVEADNASALAARETAAWGPFDEDAHGAIPLQVELRARDACLLYPAPSVSGPAAVRVDCLILVTNPAGPEVRLTVHVTWRGLPCTCYLPDDRPGVMVFIDTPVLRVGAPPDDLAVHVVAIEAPEGPVSLSLSLLTTSSSRRYPIVVADEDAGLTLIDSSAASGAASRLALPTATVMIASNATYEIRSDGGRAVTPETLTRVMAESLLEVAHPNGDALDPNLTADRLLARAIETWKRWDSDGRDRDGYNALRAARRICDRLNALAETRSSRQGDAAG